MDPGSEQEVVTVPVPALWVWLRDAEQQKGSPLVESEVLEIRDNSPCIALPKHEAAAFLAARGHDDIDPEHCWEEWQRFRSDHLGLGPL